MVVSSGRVKLPTSDPAVGFDWQCRTAGLPVGTPEVFFAVSSIGRRWRFDRAWEPYKVALEIEGGIFKRNGGGRHNRGAGMREDLIKYAEAASLGWRVVRVMPEMVRDGRALMWIERALTFGGWR